MTVYAPLAMPRARRFARINRAKRHVPMKTVTIAGLAASHGASAPALAVWRGSAARKVGIRLLAKFEEFPDGVSWFLTAMKTEMERG